MHAYISIKPRHFCLNHKIQTKFNKIVRFSKTANKTQTQTYIHTQIKIKAWSTKTNVKRTKKTKSQQKITQKKRNNSIKKWERKNNV